MKACVIALFTLFTVFIGAVTASACECTERRSVGEEIRASEHMVILILKSVENERAVLSVATTYKGDLKPDEELVFKQSAGKDCKWRFEVTDINKLFLFYLEKRPESGVWQASTCSRSGRVDDVQEDLNVMQEIKNKTGPKLRLTDEPRPAVKPGDGV
jgi:hypothetical protein